MLKVLIGIVALVVILTAVGFAKDLTVYEDGSYSSTIPLSQAWGD
jgi:hypothetical protein